MNDFRKVEVLNNQSKGFNEVFDVDPVNPADNPELDYLWEDLFMDDNKYEQYLESEMDKGYLFDNGVVPF